MNKKISLLAISLLLTACGGGGGGSGPVSTLPHASVNNSQRATAINHVVGNMTKNLDDVGIDDKIRNQTFNTDNYEVVRDAYLELNENDVKEAQNRALKNSSKRVRVATLSRDQLSATNLTTEEKKYYMAQIYGIFLNMSTLKDQAKAKANQENITNALKKTQQEKAEEFLTNAFKTALAIFVPTQAKEMLFADDKEKEFTLDDIISEVKNNEDINLKNAMDKLDAEKIAQNAPSLTIVESINKQFEGVEFKLTDFARNDKNETVAEKQITTKDGDNSITTTYMLTLGGSTIEGGLSYTDFGYFTKNTETTNPEENKVIENEMIVFQPERFELKPTENMTFKGKAYANVSGPAYANVSSIMVSGDASLSVDPTQMTESLTINFDNWYDMTLKTDSNGRASAYVKEGQNYQDNGFKFEDVGIKMGVMLDVGYYGANNKVSEASGEFEASSNNNKIEGVFGAKRQ